MTHSSLATRTQWTTDRSSRSGRKIDRFIVHHAATTSLSGILSLFKPGGRTVSANYALKDNDLVATVPEEYRAWTSSSSAWDGRAVTIEVANSSTGGKWPVSDASFRMLARLIADVAKRYGFAINDNTVLTHQELYLRYGASYATACPGDLQRRKAELLKLANDFLKGTPSSGGGSSDSGYFGTHTVKTGETLWDVANRWRMSKARLAQLNNIAENATVKAGQKLKVDTRYSEPLGTGKQGVLDVTTWPFALYNLKSGDTESEVCKKFGMGQTRFRNLNPVASNGGWRHWPPGLTVKVAIEHAPETYQYLDMWNEHVLATAQVQNRLKHVYKSYGSHLVVDGEYGPATFAVVAEFQRRYGKGLGASGKVDRKTWNALGMGQKESTSSASPKPIPEAQVETYKVKEGDTFWAISQEVGLPVDQLKVLNPGIHERALPVGEELKLAEGKTHKIASGDTLWALSKKYDTSVDALETLNPDVETDELVVGTELIVK